MEYLLDWTAVLLALAFRYNLAFSASCRALGANISSSGNKTSLQNAITPPYQTNLTIATWLSLLIFFGLISFGTNFEFSLRIGVEFVVFSYLFGFVLPKADSLHFVRRITKSMQSRYQDFETQGNEARAAAMNLLLLRVLKETKNKLN